MHPDLECFLEDAFRSVGPTSSEIGRVVVDPDYNVAPEPTDAGQLASELVQCLREVEVDNANLSSEQGVEVDIPEAYCLLRRYLRSITLQADKFESEWVEVAPPGNWI
jgi:hypothetical protein